MARRATAHAQRNETLESDERRFFNPWREFCARLPSMIDEAQDERLEAKEQDKRARKPASYRQFYVGASMLAYDRSDGRRQLYQDAAFNSKPRQDGDSVCAERRLIGRLEKMNIKDPKANLQVVGIVVVGEPQEDGGTGFRPATLWPCSERCWPRIIQPGKLAVDTLVVSVQPNKQKAQTQTVGELDAFYRALQEGRRLREPIMQDYPEEASWHEVVADFDRIVPKNLDPFENEESRAMSVQGARLAIEAYPPLRVV